MEIEAKAILTSEKQLIEVQETLKSKYNVSSGTRYHSIDRYWKVGDKTIRIRMLNMPDHHQTLNPWRYFITTKIKTKVNGAEVNQEYEQEVSEDFVDKVMIPLLGSETPFYKTKEYIQYSYKEPFFSNALQQSYYTIDCGYAYRQMDRSTGAPYIEIETLTDDMIMSSDKIQIIRSIFKTLGIDMLINDSSWVEILGDTQWTRQF